jgi:ABC-type dipeptide/oligopeptide/nickel transport system ATPase subunit
MIMPRSYQKVKDAALIFQSHTGSLPPTLKVDDLLKTEHNDIRSIGTHAERSQVIRKERDAIGVR